MQNLRIANDEMARVRGKDLKDLICNRKKLYLILDLDHTLLNSARLIDIKEEEVYLNSQRDALPGILGFSNFLDFTFIFCFLVDLQFSNNQIP